MTLEQLNALCAPFRRIRESVEGASAVLALVSALVCVQAAFAAKPYFNPQPDWPPRPFDELNGRKLEFFAHGTRPEWGYADLHEDLFAVVHPKTDRRNAPLVVVLHSAGHDLMSCLKCVRQEGNHDIYRTPDTVYALYLDCRYNTKTDWWWGDPKREFRDPAVTPVEKRLLDTIEWTIAKYGIDRDRVYLCGNSMGGSGTLGLGLAHGDIFAAVKANVPAGIEHAAARLALPPAELPAGVTLPDPPVCVDYSSQSDKWSANHERFLSGMKARKYPLLFFWGAFGHENDNACIASCNDIIHDFDWLAVKRNEPYPVFTDATSDNAHPWPVKVQADGKRPADGAAGQINGFFRWRNAVATSVRLEMEIHLASPKSKFSRLQAPEKATAAVTVRRLGAFRPAAGERIRWSFGAQSGEIAAEGLLTIPALEIARMPQKLVLERVAARLEPGEPDATPAFLAAVERVRRSGGGTIEFAKGEYVFSTKSATKLSFKISNHNQSDPHLVALPLVGLTNVTVRGNGSTLLVDGAAIGLAVLDSKNVRIEDVRLDWTRSFISDAVIEGFADGKTRVFVDPVKFPHVHSNGCFFATGTDWTNYVRYLVVCRADTHEIVGGTGDILWKGKPMEKVGPSSYLMDMDFSKLGAGARVGDVIAFRSPSRTCPGSVVYRSANTVFEDVSIHSCWGMGVICQFSENFTWRGTGRPEDRRAGVFARAETGRFFSANADASHFSNCRGRIVEENCLFEGMMDDAINVHATSVKIVEKLAPDTIRCRFMHDDAYDFELFRPGDRLRFIRPKTMENGPSMKVVSFRLEGDGHDMTIVTKHPIPEGFGVGDAVENAEAMADVVFRGNVVARNRARGALFTTTGSVLIESNVFERVAGQALLFEGDASHWYESGSLRDCVICGNVFRECNGWWPKPLQAVISFHPSYDDTAAPGKPYHRGIAIVDNTFATYRQPLVYARATENLIFSGNRVSFVGDLPWGKPRPELVVTEGRCRNVKVDDGTAEPMLWGLLLHLGSNMWWDVPRDAENPVDRNWTDCAKDQMMFDESVWREATDRMAKGGLNFLIIDIGDGMLFPSHPEIAIEGSWTPERLKAEVARLRALGIEPVPKLNFSACHDVWMKKYARMLSTPEYYAFCADVIRDVFDVFGKPRFFHIGFDEENDHPFQSYVVIRRGDLWWHDLNFLVGEVEKGGARAWIWSDAVWNHPKDFLSRMSPNVLQSNWYYYPPFDLALMKEKHKSWYPELAAYGVLENHGFDQVPTGSNWDNPSNMVNTVRFCRGKIGPSRLKGFLQTPWKKTLPAFRDRILAAVDQLVEAKKIWEEGR